MSWYSGLEAICRPDVPLAEHTWYGLGGPARWLCTPRNEEELAEIVCRCTGQRIAWRVLGRGANILVRDCGFDGAVITLTESFWDRLQFDGARVEAAAGVDFPRLVRQSLERGLIGLENLAGIPGTVGGAIRMNAGGRYGSVSQYVRHVRLMDSTGQVCHCPASALGFGYRKTNIDSQVIVGATFELTAGDRDAAMARFRDIWNEKYSSQPPVSAKSAGCIFKNPPGHAAGKLIDQAGLKGTRHGAAEISPRHANFIVAYPGATSQDVLELITLARQRVRDQSGIELELEVEVW